MSAHGGVKIEVFKFGEFDMEVLAFVETGELR